jgi:hypothetical protein
VRKLIVQVQFVVDVPDDCDDGEKQWEATVDYCREMFTAVDYPNRIGDEWYIESVEEDTEGDGEDLGLILSLYDPETKELVYTNEEE